MVIQQSLVKAANCGVAHDPVLACRNAEAVVRLEQHDSREDTDGYERTENLCPRRRATGGCLTGRLGIFPQQKSTMMAARPVTPHGLVDCLPG
jgi:hypothetical protein